MLPLQRILGHVKCGCLDHRRDTAGGLTVIAHFAMRDPTAAFDCYMPHYRTGIDRIVLQYSDSPLRRTCVMWRRNGSR